MIYSVKGLSSMAEQILNINHKRVLNYIHAGILSEGFPPSAREIANAFEVSRQRVHQLLKQLRKHGMVDWGDGDLNTLWVTEDGINILNKETR